MEKINKVAIIGAGALGIMFGKRFTEKFGRENAFFIADPKRAFRYRKEDFLCNGKPCGFRYAEDTAIGETVDLIVVAVKFTGLYEALESIRNFVGPDTIIISLLNGITSEEMIAKAYGEDHVLYCIAQGMDATKEKNAVEYQNMGTLVLGSKNNEMTENLKKLTRFLEEADVKYQIPENIQYRLWSKLMFNTGLNQVTAVYETDYAGVQKEGEPRQMMINAMKEAQKIAACEGIVLTDQDIEGWVNLTDSLNPSGMPSMRQDTKAHRKTEVELFAGTMIALGKKHHIPTPVNDFLYEKIREIENISK